ncbi:MAG: ribosome maturation factor RimM [Gammaproteobacteria bacterium]|nr:MAG: ribosome maturation factor RimM [Gammaproteobacteria bacterium]
MPDQELLVPPVERVMVGAVGKVFGLKGWVKIHSHTQPDTNLFQYRPWWLHRNGQWQQHKVVSHKSHGKGFIAQLDGYDDPDKAQTLVGYEIHVARTLLPALSEGEFYWADLEGLTVVTQNGVDLGKVHQLLETGANDVLDVRHSASSVDQEDRLIPYLEEQVIKKVDLDLQTIVVDWDPEF